MKEKLIISIMQGMLSSLDNKQLDMLRDVLTTSLDKYDVVENNSHASS